MLTGLPWAGLLGSGVSLQRYLEFPPETRFIHQAPFSWGVFAGFAVFVAGVVFLLSYFAIQNIRHYGFKGSLRYPFPWWGWVAVLGVITCWVLAWTRFSWFQADQSHSFTPLWLSFILFINALCMRRTGTCLLVHQTRYLMMLFPLSAAFWWFFEYLNRFVQNWHYMHVRFEPLTYFLFATISFSTVLPAVLSMREFMMSFEWVKRGFSNFPPIACKRPSAWAAATLLISGSGLSLVGVFPDYLFPLLWISPLLIMVSLQTLWHEQHVFSDSCHGNWQGMVSVSMAALCCGFFWEMWNMYSLAKWEYTVPFVQRYHVFEMPLLGYAGYLPFGLECAVIGGVLEKAITGKA